MNLIDQVLNSARLTPEQRIKIRGIPEVREMADREDRENVQHRARLLAEIAAVPKTFAKRTIAAVAARDAAAVRLAAAKAELDAATTAATDASSALIGLGVQEANAAGALMAELERTADPRLQRTQDLLESLVQRVRHQVTVSNTLIGLSAGGYPKSRLDSNAAEVGAALLALREGQGQCRQMALEALSRNAVTERLRSIELDLRTAFQPLNWHTVFVVDDDGSVSLAAAAATEAEAD